MTSLPSVAERAQAFRTPAFSVPWAWLAARNKKNLIAALILGPVVALALVGPYLPISGPLEVAPINSLQAPSLHHLFGTDKLGRDIFSRTVAGARVSLLIGFSSALLALSVGVVLGTVAGFMGRAVDGVIMTIVDVFLSFPSLLLVLGMVAVFGNGMAQIVLAIAVADAPRAVRLQRALALGLKNRAYIDAAHVASAPTWYILARHILPNTIAPMLVVASIFAANAILIEASLSFLNLGIVPPNPSWGNIIADGKPYLQQAWWISAFPGLALALVAVSLHLFSDGVRQNLDPRLGA
jgi:peptide/nickel transport system permease protein